VKRLVIGCWLLAAVAVGCGSTDRAWEPKPAQAEVDDYAGIRYTEVVLPNGEVIPCLYMADGVGNSGLSCDWAYGNGRHTSS